MEKTFKYLKKTENAAALELLRDSLQSSSTTARDASLRALLEHRDMNAKKEILRRIGSFDEEQKALIQKRPDLLTRVIHAVLKQQDRELTPIAIQCAREFRLYDAMPSMAPLLGDSGFPYIQDVCDALYALAESFYEELRAAKRSIDLDTERRKVTVALDEAAKKLKTHEDKRMVDAFLMVAAPNNVTLKRILQSPKDILHKPACESLQTSQHGGVIRLLLAFLEDPQMPVAARNAICDRIDLKFVDNMLRVVNFKSLRVEEVLRGIDRMAWAKPGHETLDELNGDCQHNAVELIVRTAIPREEKLPVLIHLLKNGKTSARQIAADQLAEFKESQATKAVLEGLSDEDPVVRGNLIRQLRPREVPGALSMLIRFVDCEDIPIKLALREAMPEFAFGQFILNFDSLTDDALATAGCLVSKIDIDAPAGLLRELNSLSPVRRRRAANASIAMGMVRKVESRIIELLSDDDHTVRIVAAKALAQCDSMPSWEALRDALLDRSVIVRQAAEDSLQRICSALAADTPPVEEEDDEEAGARPTDTVKEADAPAKEETVT